MKSKFVHVNAVGSMLFCLSCFLATNPVQAADETIDGNLSVTGWGQFEDGVDIGTAAQNTIYWNNSQSVVVNDINLIQGSFVWRDTYNITNNLATARNKLLLGSSNELTIYKSDGTTAGIIVDPDSGKITLPPGVTNAGIYFGSNPIISASANGSAIFPSAATFSNGLSISAGSLSLGSSTLSTATGKLVVSNGIEVNGDSWINGVRIGKGADQNNSSTVIGGAALNLSTSSNGHNTAVGYGALSQNTISFYNSAVGAMSGSMNQTGNLNTSVGAYSLSNNTDGGNTAIGADSMLSKVTGYGNSSFGATAFRDATSGAYNLALGFGAGRYLANGSTSLTSASNSIFIGANSRGYTNGDSNTIVIGANAVGEGANTTVIGSSATTRTKIFGTICAGGGTISNGALVAIGGVADTTHSVAIGAGSSARGTYNSLAMMGAQTGIGEGGREAIAIGPLAKAMGAASTAVGYGAETTSCSNAFGLNAKATGYGSNAAGWLSIASGQQSTAVGYGANAINTHSLALGYMAKALHVGAAAIGAGSEATKVGSFAAGYYVTSNSFKSSALGANNVGILGNEWNWIENEVVFELGNGIDSTNKSNAITTLKNGQTTLTNKAWKANVAANPSQTLVDPPATTTDSGGNALVVEGHTILKGKVVIEQAQGDISMGIYQ